MSVVRMNDVSKQHIYLPTQVARAMFRPTHATTPTETPTTSSHTSRQFLVF